MNLLSRRAAIAATAIRLWGSARRSAASGWCIGLVFVILFWVFTLLRAWLPGRPLHDSRWLVVVAALAVVPALLDHLGLRRLKWGALEATFQRPAELEAYTSRIGTDLMPHAASLPIFVTHYWEVMEKADHVVERRAEVLLLDLGSGQIWWFSRLYVLAWMLRHSRVDTVALFEGPSEARVFVGICTLDNLLASLESRMPDFTRAAQGVLVRERASFQQAAGKLQEQAPGDLGLVDVSSTTLRERLPSLVLADGTVEWRNPLPPSDVRAVLASPQRFWAVTRAGHLWSFRGQEFLLDRDKLALAVARRAARQPS